LLVLTRAFFVNNEICKAFLLNSQAQDVCGKNEQSPQTPYSGVPEARDPRQLHRLKAGPEKNIVSMETFTQGTFIMLAKWNMFTCSGGKVFPYLHFAHQIPLHTHISKPASQMFGYKSIISENFLQISTRKKWNCIFDIKTMKYQLLTIDCALQSAWWLRLFLCESLNIRGSAHENTTIKSLLTLSQHQISFHGNKNCLFASKCIQ